MKFNVNLFNRASGVKLSPFKAGLSMFVDFTIPKILMTLGAVLAVLLVWAFRIGVIVIALYIIIYKFLSHGI